MKKIKRYRKLIYLAWNLEGNNLPILVVMFRLFKWMIKRDGLFMDFFMLGMHKAETVTAGILTEPEFQQLQKQLNPMYYRCLLEDKFIFDRFFKGFDCPLAEMIGAIENDRIWWFDQNLYEPLDDLVKHDNLECFVKMHTNWGGEGVFKLAVRNGEIFVNNKTCPLDKLKKLLASGFYVIQKRVIQHAALDRLNDSCVNTVRMITIHDGRHAHSFVSYLRIGAGTGLVDNLIQGGIGCAVNKDGTLYDRATDIVGNHVWIKNHPKSNVPFGSFVIPFYSEAWETVIRMHSAFHCFFMIGWDVAITEDGPVIIEGNPLGRIAYEQWLFGGLKLKILEYAGQYSDRKRTWL